jgi:hypothetical protein
LRRGERNRFWGPGEGIRHLLRAVLLVHLSTSIALAADESVLIEEPPPKSVLEESGPLNRAFEDPPEPEPVLLPRLKDRLADLPPVFRDTEISLEFRNYYFRRRRNFNDANEKAWGLGASMYFGAIGVPDLSLAIRHAEGYGRDLGDRRELNATTDYLLRFGPLRGFWLRARFGWGQVDGARRDSFEGRLILRYEFRLL